MTHSLPTGNRTGVIDCFAGIGGFAHALTDPRFGYHVALTVEMDPAARHVYHASFPSHDPSRTVVNIRRLTWRTPGGEVPTDEEVTAFEQAHLANGALRPASDEEILDVLHSFGVDPTTIGMVVGGFPCTTFSKSGAQQGIRDVVRGSLFGDLARLIEAIQPDHALLENVPNLAGERHRDWFTTILTRLRAAGYGIGDDEVFLSPDRIAPEHGGTPQIRKRLFFGARRLDPTTRDTDAAHTGIDLDTLTDLFSWDPARWDAEEICDPDDSFDTAPYLLAEREVVWLTAWNTLLQALPVDDLPGDLFADAFTPGFTVEEGTHPAKAAKLRRSHAFYLTQQAVIDEWMATTWNLGGEQVTVADFPATRRILEWQARSAQPTAADRDVWQCTMSMRSSGIRVKPLTTLPALVALNTTSIIGPRGRYITPREAARLQGMPVPVWEPRLPAPNARRAPRTPLEDLPDLEHVTLVPVTDPDVLRHAATVVTDLWWERGGFADTAVAAALAAADQAGATPGEILLAAAALASRQNRWRGSGLRWADLAWDTYRMLAAAGDPISYDAAFAAIDWRVRRRGTLAVTRAAGYDQDRHPDPVDALTWFAERVDIRLPAAGDGGWDARALDVATAAREHHLDVEWLRALHRSALLARWDDREFHLDDLVTFDLALASHGVLDLHTPAVAGTATQIHTRYRASQAAVAARLGVPAPNVASRNSGTGTSTVLLPLDQTTLNAGRARLEQITDVWSTGVDRVNRLAATGQRDPRTEASVLDAQRQYILAAFDLRRHRAMRSQLRHAGYVAAALDSHTRSLGQHDPAVGDAALACIEAWARYVIAPPHGPVPALVLPEAPRGNNAPSWLPNTDQEPTSMLEVLTNADATVAVCADDAGIAGWVMAAHYERQRAVLAHLVALVEAGVLTEHDADQVTLALTRMPNTADLAHGCLLTAQWAIRTAAGGPLSWAALTEPANLTLIHTQREALSA